MNQDKESRYKNAEQITRNTEHRTRNTEHGTRNAKHGSPFKSQQPFFPRGPLFPECLFPLLVIQLLKVCGIQNLPANK